jgi:NADH dehydrogenase
VRDPRRLGPNRVRVQITLGDLADPVSIRQAVRGVDTVVHLAAAIRDQPGGTIEELNGIATIRLLRAAQSEGVKRFIFFGALGATFSSSTRFFRSKALGQQAVLASPLESYVLAPSIAYAPGDPFLTLLSRMSLFPWMPIAGSGAAAYQPIWAADIAACATALVARSAQPAERLLELAGPDTLTYEQIVRLVLEATGRRRPIVHVPLPIVRRGLGAVERFSGDSAFATWEEAELMEVAMVSRRGTADARSLGIDPEPMRDVLGLEPAGTAV